MVEKAAVETSGLSKSYGGRRAVSDVALFVRAGEVHGLLGRNGAGKTTLLRMLLGLVRPDAGAVRLLGARAGTMAGPTHRGVAGFADAPRFYPYLSGRRNLRLLARLDDGQGEETDAAIDAALDDVKLTADADAKLAGYSAGMRQRLGLASALLRSPRVLLLDEPTSSLDPEGARHLRDHVRRLAADGVAVLFSSHDLREVEDLCASLTVVDHGRVVFSGTLRELRAQLPATVHRLGTSDPERARAVGDTQTDVVVTASDDDARLDVSASEAALDRYVIALGKAGIAVRSLETRDRSLESLFLRLTSGDAPGAPTQAPGLGLGEDDASAPGSSSQRGASAAANALRWARAVARVARVELSKLAAQSKVWVTLGACVAGPFAFVLGVKLQSNVPEDTLFGRWVNASGFAVPLVVLGFAASWALPVVTSIVGGDLFSSEDRYGTWPTLLTRSRTRGEIFAGKTLAAFTFSFVAVLATGMSAIAAGTLLVGTQPLLSLSGTELSPHRALALVAFAWVSVLPPAFGFTGLALFGSVATRSSAAGIGLPVLFAFAMQLYAFVNGPEMAHRAMLTSSFDGWHGLFCEPSFHRPLIEGIGISAAYLVASVTAAYVLFRRRDMGS